MSTEIFDILNAEVAAAADDNRVDLQCWPTNPPVADPVSGGTMRLWQFGGSPQCRAEIFQPAHTLITKADDTLNFSLDEKSATLFSGTGYNGLLLEPEVANQTNLVVFKYTGTAHLFAWMGNATPTAGDGGFVLTTLSPFNSVRFTSQGIAANDTIALPSAAIGKYVVAAVSHSATSRQARILGSTTASRTGVVYPGCVRPVAAGNGAWSTSYSFGQSISAAAQAPMLMTQAQLLSCCEWLAKIEKNRGVDVYG